MSVVLNRDLNDVAASDSCVATGSGANLGLSLDGPDGCYEK